MLPLLGQYILKTEGFVTKGFILNGAKAGVLNIKWSVGTFTTEKKYIHNTIIIYLFSKLIYLLSQQIYELHYLMLSNITLAK